MTEKLLPCPFCGVRIDDRDYPPSEIHGGDTITFECGCCGATWPRLARNDALEMSDGDIYAFFNRRAPSTSAGETT